MDASKMDIDRVEDVLKEIMYRESEELFTAQQNINFSNEKKTLVTRNKSAISGEKWKRDNVENMLIVFLKKKVIFDPVFVKMFRAITLY